MSELLNDNDAIMYSDILRTENPDIALYNPVIAPKDEMEMPMIISVVDAGSEIDESESGLYTIRQLLPEATEDEIMCAEACINGYQLMNSDDVPLFPDLNYLMSALEECGAALIFYNYFKSRNH